MGINTFVKLPDNVRLEDVAKVIGIAVGYKPETIASRNNPAVSWTEVNGVEIKTTSVPSMVNIVFGGRHCSYFFEHESGGRLVYTKSTSFWIAVSKRLVDFFGGEVDFNDCDESDVDYKKKANSSKINRPSDGKAWYDFQARLLKVKPIHRDEVDDDYYEYNYDDDGFMIR